MRHYRFITELADNMPMATVRLHADTLEPGVVSALLGIVPDMAAAKGGSAFKKKDGSFSTAPTGIWFATTAGRIASLDPHEHLKWVVHIAHDRINALSEAVPGLLVDLFLFVPTGGFNVEGIPADLLECAAAAGATSIDVTCADLSVVVPTR